MLILSIIIGGLVFFGFGYYLGHQIGGTEHIRLELTSSTSERLKTDS